MRSTTAHRGDAGLLRVGDLARKTGKTVRAIHLYEELGLLRPATRSSGGFRLYEPGAVERVRWIDLLHGLGFSLHEMGEVLEGWWGANLGREAMGRLRSLFLRKLDETRESMRRFQRLEGELQEGLAYLETCRVCATPTVEVEGCVHCTQDHGMKQEPALVAGIMFPPGRAQKAPRPGLVRLEEIE